MFTIKAYTPSGSTNIFEATEVRINSNKTELEFIRPGSDLLECLLVNGEMTDYATAYIENSAGRTVESLKS